MVKINVNINEARQTSNRLSPVHDEIEGVVKVIRKLEFSIDPRVMQQFNIRQRLVNLRTELSHSMNDVRNLQNGINTMLRRYEDTDRDIRAKVVRAKLSQITSVGTDLSAARPASLAAYSNQIGGNLANYSTGATATGTSASATPGIIERVKNVKVT